MMRKRILFAMLLPTLLSGCMSQDDDLAKFMNEADQTVVAPVEPLPQVQKFTPMQYNADATLHDPFMPRKTAVQNTNQPDLKRPKEPLEAYPLEGLKFVGVMSKKNQIFATIQTPDNMIYQVKPGSHMGQNFGVITALAEDRETLKYALTIKETIQDPISGEWSEQLTTLQLQEHQ